jgi:hypothetical protein
MKPPRLTGTGSAMGAGLYPGGAELIGAAAMAGGASLDCMFAIGFPQDAQNFASFGICDPQLGQNIIGPPQ